MGHISEVKVPKSSSNEKYATIFRLDHARYATSHTIFLYTTMLVLSPLVMAVLIGDTLYMNTIQPQGGGPDLTLSTHL